MTDSGKVLAGKVVLVTGSGGGIGRAIAIEMARSGAKVVVNDIGASLTGDATGLNPGQQVVAEIRAAGGEAVHNADNRSL
jgi:NAD(P)-dependent dehydrogenase (short-subunit alcohol dehydrogenase family)